MIGVLKYLCDTFCNAHLRGQDNRRLDPKTASWCVMRTFAHLLRTAQNSGFHYRFLRNQLIFSSTFPSLWPNYYNVLSLICFPHCTAKHSEDKYWDSPLNSEKSPLLLTLSWPHLACHLVWCTRPPILRPLPISAPHSPWLLFQKVPDHHVTLGWRQVSPVPKWNTINSIFCLPLFSTSKTIRSAHIFDSLQRI